jgi:surfactin synthase thioesterase subunit
MYISMICLVFCGGGASLLRAWLPVHPEAIQAGVLRVAPVGEHPYLDDLEGLLVLLQESRANRRRKSELRVCVCAHVRACVCVRACVHACENFVHAEGNGL